MRGIDIMATADTDTDTEQESIPAGVELPVKVAGQAVLHAAWFRRLKLTKLLLLGGEDLNAQNEDGQTALMVAILSGHEDTLAAGHAHFVRYLIEQGADVAITDKYGQTALTLACKEPKCPEVVKALLEAGSDPTRLDRFGRNALQMAAQLGETEILDMMARHCKAKGKEVIIVTRKTAVVAPIARDDNFAKVTVQSAAIPPIVVKSGQPARDASAPGERRTLCKTLSVPVSRDLTADRVAEPGGSGKRCVYGSPRPRTKFSHTGADSEVHPAGDGDRRGSYTLSVNPIAEVNDTWIPREEDAPDVLGLIGSMPPGMSPTSWAMPKPPPSRKKLVRRATVLAIGQSMPLPSPQVIQEGVISLQSPEELNKVKADLLTWEKELARRGFPRKPDKPPPIVLPKVTGRVQLTSIEGQPSIPASSGDAIPGTSGTQKTARRRRSRVSLSKDSAISSGEEEEGEDGAGFLPTREHHTRSKVVGPKNKFLQRQGSATRLLDHLSQARPGNLPPLNVNMSRPIPGISDKPIKTEEGGEEVTEEEAEDGNTFAETLTPHQRLLASNPKRKFFTRRSQTIGGVPDESQLISLNFYL